MGDWLRDRVAIITGAGRGIGKEIALAMAQEGAKVVTDDCDPGLAEMVAKQIADLGGQAAWFYGDISAFETARKLIQTAVDNFGRLDVLVNNAGVAAHNLIWDMTEDDWDYVISVNLKGTFNCIRHASRIMKEQRWGRIINTTSDAWRGSTGQSNYCAAKGGIVSFTRAIARDLGRYGVTCNCIAPLAATRMTMDEELKAIAKKSVEAGAITEDQYKDFLDMPGPEFVAPAVVYLATEEAANINGQVIGCGGGRVALYSEPVEVKGIYRDYKKEGPWTVDELIRLVPGTLLAGYVNPAPADSK